MEERDAGRSVQDVPQALGIVPSLLYKCRNVYGDGVAPKRNEVGETLSVLDVNYTHPTCCLKRECYPVAAAKSANR